MSVLHFLKYSSVLAFLSLGFYSYAQDSTAIHLKDVEVRAIPYSKYATGSKIQRFDSLILQQYNAQQLGELLMQQSSIYIKEYGNGMLNSISFRGTGSSHTAVLWNGININLPTLGQSDFAILPLFAQEKIEIQAGASSSMYGSDALGGSVHIFSTPDWKKKIRLNAQQNIGSFGTFFTGLRVEAGNEKIQVKSYFYRTGSDNDFEFKNTSKIGKPIERQLNAGYWNVGFTQEIHFKIDKNRYIALKGWYHESHRQIQPVMSSLESNDNQKDLNLRTMIELVDQSAYGNLNAKFAYLRDELWFDDYAPSKVNRYIAQLDYEKNIGRKLSLKAGANWVHFQTDYENYGKAVSENRNDAFLSVRYAPFSFWTFSINARQAFVKGFAAPFAPSIGNEWKLVQHPVHRLLLKTLCSRNYRVPTLNDRYWQPGGNPDLKSENSLSAEGTLVYTIQKPDFQLEAALTYYQMLVDNWIIWLPNGSYWSPTNLQKVGVKGLESNLKISGKINPHLHINFTFNYAYTQSTNLQATDPYDRSVNRQLIYTPFHRFNFSQNIAYKKWLWMLNGNFTDYRYTVTDNSRFLSAFFLINTAIGKNWNTKQSDFSLTLKINNLLNTAYQNYENYAMPGISYQISMRYQWKKLF